MEIPFPDLVRFYVSHVSQTALAAAVESQRLEDLWAATRTVRECLILLATVLGAFPRKKLEQISRLKRKALDLENSMHKIDRLGEDMVLLRLWCRNAQDAQLPIETAVRLVTAGKDERLLPSLTADLVLCAKLPYVVVDKCTGDISGLLQSKVARQFAVWKANGEIPERATLQFAADGVLEISSLSGDFSVKCVYDMKRWFVVEARIFGNLSENFKTVVQQFPVKRAFQVAALCKLRQWYMEASGKQKLPDSSITAVEFEDQKRLKIQIAADLWVELFLAGDGDLHATDELVDLTQPMEISINKLARVWAEKKLDLLSDELATVGGSQFPTLRIENGLIILVNCKHLVLLELTAKGKAKLVCSDLVEERTVYVSGVVNELVRLSQIAALWRFCVCEPRVTSLCH